MTLKHTTTVRRNFTEEQNLFREGYRSFLAQEVKPHMERFRKQGIVDREIFRKAGELGYLMTWPDEKYGGFGDDDFRFEQIIIEETMRAGCFDWELVLAVAMSEPDAESDLSGMRSTLADKGDYFLLNGSKTYISNGINGDVIIVAAKTVGAESKHALTLCVVERDMEGFKRGKNLEKMGLKGQDTAELFFDNVKIPRENILGEPGRGFYYLMQGLAEERLIAACQATANARHAFDITREYVMERKAFGKPISDFQNTQFKMAEMDAEIDMLQVYIDHCVMLNNQNALTGNAGAKVKLLATEIEWKMMDLGVQLHGGAGYMSEYEICRMFTDARVNRIYAGTSEIMKLIIGRDVFSDRYKSILE